MTVTFWGVRGSTPAPGSDTVRYGGNTACVSVELSDRLLVLDAGTGIQELGRALTGEAERGTDDSDGTAEASGSGDGHLPRSDASDRPITVVLTHLHTDHISGFPFFGPLYDAECTIDLVGYPHDGRYWSLLDLLDGVHFPLTAAEVAADCRVVEAAPHDALDANSETVGVSLRSIDVTHPGGAFGYRLDGRSGSFVFIPDHEIGADTVATPFDEVADFCQGADVLCHDAQYVDDEFPERRGWGHSRVRDACALAVAAGVGHLVLFHHDPERSDDALDRIEHRAREFLSDHGIDCTAAYEGLSFDL